MLLTIKESLRFSHSVQCSQCFLEYHLVAIGETTALAPTCGDCRLDTSTQDYELDSEGFLNLCSTNFSVNVITICLLFLYVTLEYVFLLLKSPKLYFKTKT